MLIIKILIVNLKKKPSFKMKIWPSKKQEKEIKPVEMKYGKYNYIVKTSLEHFHLTKKFTNLI